MQIFSVLIGKNYFFRYHLLCSHFRVRVMHLQFFLSLFLTHFLLQQTINFDSTRGGISLVTEKGIHSSSRLLVQSARTSDAGTYQCAPDNAHSATARVHVLTGKFWKLLRLICYFISTFTNTRSFWKSAILSVNTIVETQKILGIDLSTTFFNLIFFYDFIIAFATLAELFVKV